MALDSTRYEGYAIVGSFLSRQSRKYRNSQVDLRKEQALADRLTAGSLLATSTFKEPLNPCPHISFISHLIEIEDYSLADDATGRFRELIPQSPQAWFLRGLTRTLLGDYASAEIQFSRALAMLSPEQKAAFLDVSDLVAWEDSTGLESWKNGDPFLLTRENERLVSHYARLVFADLLYPLWRTYLYEDDYITPGDLIVRYGFPTYSNMESGDYSGTRMGDRPIPKGLNLVIPTMGSFRFDDEWSSGDWVIPSADVIMTKDVFRQQPTTPDPPKKQPFEIPYAISFLKGMESGVDVLVTTGVPLAQQSNAVSSMKFNQGIFLRNSNATIFGGEVTNEDIPAGRYSVPMDSLNVWTKPTVLNVDVVPSEVIVEGQTDAQIAALRTTIDQKLDYSIFSVSSPVLSTLVEEDDSSDSKKGQKAAKGVFLKRNGYAIYPLPFRVVSASTAPFIYFEVYNIGLEKGSGAQGGFDLTIQLTKFNQPRGLVIDVFKKLTDLVLQPESAKVAVSVAYTASTINQANYVILDLADYVPGLYQIDLIVVDKKTGAKAHSTTDLWLR